MTRLKHMPLWTLPNFFSPTDFLFCSAPEKPSSQLPPVSVVNTFSTTIFLGCARRFPPAKVGKMKRSFTTPGWVRIGLLLRHFIPFCSVHLCCWPVPMTMRWWCCWSPAHENVWIVQNSSGFQVIAILMKPMWMKASPRGVIRVRRQRLIWYPHPLEFCCESLGIHLLHDTVLREAPETSRNIQKHPETSRNTESWKCSNGHPNGHQNKAVSWNNRQKVFETTGRRAEKKKKHPQITMDLWISTSSSSPSACWYWYDEYDDG